MTPLALNHKFLYSFNYDYHHEELCKLESRQIFGKEIENKLLISGTKIDPSISPFIKSRLDILSSAEDYQALLAQIKEQDLRLNDFNVEYLRLHGDLTEKPERREKQKDVGYCIYGKPDFKNPIITYAICHYADVWYFGVIHKENIAWHKHRKKPNSFSNSIGTTIGKTLVTIASKGLKTNRLLDACCGVGTVLLEACISGYTIDGCDINIRAYQHALQNLEYYGYTASLHHSDIKDITQTYDAAIIDLPYNLYSLSDEDIPQHIIAATATLTDRMVIVSISDIRPILLHSGLKVVDTCTVEKRGRSEFSRTIWVCQKEA